MMRQLLGTWHGPCEQACGYDFTSRERERFRNKQQLPRFGGSFSVCEWL